MTAENHLKNTGCSPVSFVERTVQELAKKIGTDHVVMGLSGGVDSTVSAVLLHKAIGNQLHCIFVDHGLLRKNEFEQVLSSYQYMGLNVKGVSAGARFFKALKGLTDPELKRKAIGHTFIQVFEEEALQIEGAKWLGQGTIYPDIIESKSQTGDAVKSHHNVGGLPDSMKLQLVEPLKMLYKDEVRLVGSALGMDPYFLMRHPFPGPGLGIRVLGEVTPERVHILQEADHIFIEGLRAEKHYNQVWQAAVILLPIHSVGVNKGKRTYEHPVVLRVVCSTDAMTADWAPLPYDFLARISHEIISQVHGVNRVVYDISAKPPATIEWE